MFNLILMIILNPNLPFFFDFATKIFLSTNDEKRENFSGKITFDIYN